MQERGEKRKEGGEGGEKEEREKNTRGEGKRQRGTGSGE
jgi:hypothetical protein